MLEGQRLFQQGNQVQVPGVCRIIARIIHSVNLTDVCFDHEPRACVGHDAWGSEGLPVPPSEVVAEGWTAVLRYLRVRCFCAQCERFPRPADAFSPRLVQVLHLLRVRRVCALYLNLLRAQLTPSPRPALSSPTA